MKIRILTKSVSVGVPMTRRCSGGVGKAAFMSVTDVGVAVDMVVFGCVFTILLALSETTGQR